MGSNNQPRQRDREGTQRRLIEAAVEILREQGYASLGVNAIAERAGVSKVLIYRYFGDLSGLLDAVPQHLDFTKTGLVDTDLFAPGDPAPFRDRIREAFLEFHDRVASDELTQQLMIQELQADNELTRAFADARERRGVDASDRVAASCAGWAADGTLDVDIHALLALASAGFYYLTLRSRTVQMFNGVDIQSSEGWYRISDTLALLMERALQAPGGGPRDPPPV